MKARLLADVLEALPKLRDPINELCEAVRFEAAAEGNEHAMWTDVERFPVLERLNTVNISRCIQLTGSQLTVKAVYTGGRRRADGRAQGYPQGDPEARAAVHRLERGRGTSAHIHPPPLLAGNLTPRPSMSQYVVEIRKDERRDIPANWTLLSSTKYLRRYHTPCVRTKLQERAQFKEALVLEAHKAYLSFLAGIVEQHYALLRDAVNRLAVVDCLFSLAQVAAQEGYCRPEFVVRTDSEGDDGEGEAEDVLEIVQGRHPMIEALRTDPFVPNGLKMGGGETRHKIITGPNMGGKSSAVRMTALCAIVSAPICFRELRSVCMLTLSGIDGAGRLVRPCGVDGAHAAGWGTD